MLITMLDMKSGATCILIYLLSSCAYHVLDHESVVDLFEGRSGGYSDRVVLIVSNTMIHSRGQVKIFPLLSEKMMEAAN